MDVRTRLTDLLGCRVPIQQAPMGAVSTPSLAVAVAEAGGIGSVTALGLGAAALDALLSDMTRQTGGALAANFLTEQVDLEAVEVAARRVRIVDFFWADPDASLVEIVHRNGALAAWQVGSIGEARMAQDVGCDLIVVQGEEAGGHVRGYVPLRPLLDEVLGQVHVPVLASGGVADGAAFAAMLAAGAAGVRVGTRFVASVESGAHPAYKQAVVDALSGATQISDDFPICPLCATVPRVRVLRSCVEAVRRFEGDVVGETTMFGARVTVPKGHGMPPGVDAVGHIDAMAMYAGESVAVIRAVEPVAAIIRSWVAEAELAR